MSQEQYDPTCVFCKIALGISEEPPMIVAEVPSWLAFFPTEPATLGHTLVVPRKHVPDLWMADAVTRQELIDAVQVVGSAIDSAVHPDGMNLVTSRGTAAEQTVFHLHLHIVPRWTDDGFGKIWPGDGVTDTNELTLTAQAVRAHIDGTLPI